MNNEKLTRFKFGNSAYDPVEKISRDDRPQLKKKKNRKKKRYKEEQDGQGVRRNGESDVDCKRKEKKTKKNLEFSKWLRGR
jgi:hypothetical protein